MSMAEAFDVADRGSLRWLQTLSIGNLAISVFRRNDAFRDRLPQLKILYQPPSADTHAAAVSGIATTRSYAGAARIRPSVCRVRPRR